MTDLVADAYASIPTFRTFVRNEALDDAGDPDSALELLALEAAARAIDRACNRTFRVASATPSARVFTPVRVAGHNPLVYPTSSYPFTWYPHYELSIDDVADPSGLTVAFDSTGNGDYTVAITAFRVGPTNAAAKGVPYTKLVFDRGTYPPIDFESVQVTAKFGWAAIPTTITNANLIQASRLWKRRDAPFGIAGSPEMGNEIRLLAKLDPDVALLVGAFKRNWGVVD